GGSMAARRPARGAGRRRKRAPGLRLDVCDTTLREIEGRKLRFGGAGSQREGLRPPGSGSAPPWIPAATFGVDPFSTKHPQLERTMRTTAAFLSLTVLAVGLGAAAAPAAAQYGPAARIWVDNDREFFRHGDRLRVNFSSSANSYV